MALQGKDVRCRGSARLTGVSARSQARLLLQDGQRPGRLLLPCWTHTEQTQESDADADMEHEVYDCICCGIPANRHKQLICLPRMSMERAGTWHAPPGLLTESHHMVLQMQQLSWDLLKGVAAAEEPGHCAPWEGALAL